MPRKSRKQMLKPKPRKRKKRKENKNDPKRNAR